MQLFYYYYLLFNNNKKEEEEEAAQVDVFFYSFKEKISPLLFCYSSLDFCFPHDDAGDDDKSSGRRPLEREENDKEGEEFHKRRGGKKLSLFVCSDKSILFLLVGRTKEERRLIV